MVQGANDPRVNINESNQMVDALRKRGGHVDYMVCLLYTSPCSAAAEIIEASKSPKAMSRILLGADILAISSNAVRLMPVAET